MPSRKNTRPRRRKARFDELWKTVRKHQGFLLAALLIAGVFFWVGPRHSAFDGPYRLAKLMLQGRLSFPAQLHWMEMYQWDGRWFIAYPPMVSLLLVPVVLLLPWLSFGHLNTLVFIGAAVAFRQVIKNIPTLSKIAVPAMLLYAFGTTITHCVASASVWSLMHGQGNLFLCMSLVLILKRKALWLAGIFFGIACSCRLAISPSLLGIAFLFQDDRGKFPKSLDGWKPFSVFLFGAFVPLAVNSYLNFRMTGSLFISPYDRFFETWQNKGPTFSGEYFVRNLGLYLARPPEFLSVFPFVTFPTSGQSMWMLSPFLLGAIPALFRVRGRLLALGVCAGLLLSTYLFYFYGGRNQFGTRYVIDSFPYLLPFALLGFNLETKNGKRALVALGCLSVAICSYGTYVTTFLK